MQDLPGCLPRRPPAISLTRSQESVTALVALNLKNQQIAERLGISTSRVRTLVCGAFHRLGLESRLQLALWWHNQNRAA